MIIVRCRTRPATFTAIIALASVLTFLLIPGTARADSWTLEADSGIGIPYSTWGTTVGCFASFDDGSGERLFAGVYNTDENTTGGKVFRCDGPDPDDWTQVNTDGFGSGGNHSILSMAVFAHGGTEYLYVGTSGDGLRGCRVYRTAGVGGPPYTDWELVNTVGFGDANNHWASAMAVYEVEGTDCLYVGTYNGSGGEVWRTAGTGEVPYTDWTQVNTNGFGDNDNYRIDSMVVYEHDSISYLYVGTRKSPGNGCELWRTAGAGSPEHTDWTQVNTDGFGSANNQSVASMVEFAHDGTSYLYASVYNAHERGAVYRTAGGGGPPYTWTRVDNGSFGFNLGCMSLAAFSHDATDYLYVGTAGEGKLWRTAGGGGPPYNDWTQVNSDYFDAGHNNSSVERLAVFGGDLYAGVVNYQSGCEVWRSAGTSTVPYTDWAQANMNGFSANNSREVAAMAEFKGQLYVGTFNKSTGCQVYRCDGPDPGDWTQVNENGFGDSANRKVTSMAVFSHGGQEYLYAGTGTEKGYGARLWRTKAEGGPPYNWENVADGLSNNDLSITSLAVFSHGGTEYLYAGTRSTGGCRLWRTAGTGDVPYTDWEPVNDDGFGNFHNQEVSSMTAGGGYLYAGTANDAGSEVWRSAGSGSVPYDDWTRVNTDGFGYHCRKCSSLAMFAGSLHAGASGWVLRYGGGTNWSRVNDYGFGDHDNVDVCSMLPLGGFLYAGTSNREDGCQVWKSVGAGGPPYTDWEKVNGGGFGSANNMSASALSWHNDRLHAGTLNYMDGCEVWGGTVRGTITSVVPCSAPAGSEVTVNGAGFGSERGASFLSFGSTRATTYSEWGWDSITCTVPPTAVGSADITVTTHWGETSNAFPFTLEYPVPTVTSLSPSRRTEGSGAFTLTVNGTNFVNDSVVKWNGNNRTTTYVNPTRLTASIPASDVKSAGTAQVTVFNPAPGGGTSDARIFTINAAPVTTPTISSINPEYGPPGTTVTISGNNFGNTRGTTKKGRSVQASSYVSFNGVQATKYLQWTNTEIKASVPQGATSGPVTVVVNGASSNADRTFTVNYPTWYLAEGTTDWGFDTYISIQNPNDTEVKAKVTYQTKSGPEEKAEITLPAASQTTINPRDDLGATDFSTKVKCTTAGKTIAVDRTMTWNKAGSEEAHCSVGVTAPGTTWYMPEGSASWGFECWLLIQNPDPTNTATCQVTYMIENVGARTVTRTVPPATRSTFNMADDMADVAVKDASIQVTSDIPVIPERAMYRNDRREGHDSIGTTTPATDYYLAEGATGYNVNYITYVLVQNPNTSATDVNISYQTGTGIVTGPSFRMDPNSRKTIRVNDQLPANTDVSTHVQGSQPIIAERAMYWNNGTGEACHDSIGMASPHTTFYLPDGQSSSGRETWTLVQNPNGADVQVDITYMTPTGEGNVRKTETIPANSRKTFNMAEHSGMNGRASIMVSSRGASVMVERAMYWNNRGAGTDTIGGAGTRPRKRE